MICPYCQTNNRDTAKFCDYCGAELPTVAPDAREMFGRDEFFIDGTSAITVDLEGLERMVDSSNSHVAPQMGYSVSPNDTDAAQSRTIPLGEDSNMTRPLGGAAVYGASPVRPVGSSHASEGTAQFQAVSDRSGYSKEGVSKQYTAPEKRKGSGKKKAAIAIVAILAAIALAAAGVFASYNLQLWGGKTVPDVIRQTEEAAKASLEEDGFAVNSHYVVADDVEGIVLATDPAPGNRVEEGSTVTMDVSIPRVVPDVVGLPTDQALAALADSGYLDVETVTTKSNDAEGTVLAVSPEEGQQATSDAHITLTVAEPYRVPDVSGMSKDEAVAALAAEGYTAETVTVNTEDVAEGMAVGTEPAAGSVLASGSAVKLQIAHNRSTELIALAREWFSAGNYTIRGQNYQLGEVLSVTYKGNDVCAFSISARPYETHSWFGLEPETRYGNYETIDGTIAFNPDNSVASTDPAITKE